MFRCVARTCLVAASVSVIGGACALPEEDEDLGSSELASTLDDSLRAIATENGLTPYPHSTRYDFDTYEQRHTVRLRADLGRLLFFDHIMSGVEQTSCGTCHSAEFQMADERNIARGTFCNMNADLTQIFCDEAPAGGEGGNVTGPDRLSPLNQRNTPPIINTALFPKQMWNGRFSFVDDLDSTDVNELDASLGLPDPGAGECPVHPLAGGPARRTSRVTEFSRAVILVFVALVITAGVYGVVGLIVKMDDVGLRLAQVREGLAASFGRGLVRGMPVVLSVLAKVGIAAMLWVGGHILLVGLDELGASAPYDGVHQLEEDVDDALGPVGGVAAWLTNTGASAILGVAVGAIVVAVTQLQGRAGRH